MSFEFVRQISKNKVITFFVYNIGRRSVLWQTDISISFIYENIASVLFLIHSINNFMYILRTEKDNVLRIKLNIPISF